MQRFAVIGLGRFGSRLAVNLAAAGQEVMAIDRDREVIQSMRDQVTLAIVMDATDEQAMAAQGVNQVDVAVVSIGDSFEAAALTTVILKQSGVQRVISRAVTRTGARILSRIGADDVVNPEDEAADRWATRLTSPQFINHFEIAEGHSIVELGTPSAWVGRPLSELRPRSNMGLHVVAIKHPAADPQAQSSRVEIPQPDRPLDARDVLVVMGKDDDLAQISEAT